MLEYDFNELDNDFITIWSSYILGESYDKTPKGLEELASLGQINAIQSLLLFYDQQLRYKDITKRVYDKIGYLENKNYEANFNEELIIQHAMRRYRNTDNAYLQYSALVNNNLSNEAHLYDYVLSKHLLAYTASKNPLILQRYYEIKKGNRKLISKLTVKRLREELRELYYKDTNNSAVAFAYAKNLFFFGSENEKFIGRNILNNLSNREFSSQLQEYIDKIGKENKQKIAEDDDEMLDRLFGDLRERLSLIDESESFIDDVCELRDKEQSDEPEQLSIFDLND